MSLERRSVYLITLSRADLEKVPDRQTFADIWVRAFGGAGAVYHWACCKEQHNDGAAHYHLALKLKLSRRWRNVKERVTVQSGIVCHFQEFHTNYYDAFRYVTKEDEEYLVSENHPDLTNQPRTTAASLGRRRSIQDRQLADESDQVAKKSKHTADSERKLDMAAMFNIITTRNLRTEKQLLLLAKKQNQEGKTDLLQFIMRQTSARRKDMIKTAWEIENSEIEMEREGKPRLELLREAREWECKCNDQWIRSAVEVLEGNGIDIEQFKAKVLRVLELGREKRNNLMIIGYANCGKTFLFKPMTKIFNAFVSPASGTFAWVGAEQKEIVFLNDLRWNEKLIPWSDFLNLLEGLPIHLPAPKTHFAEDILWEKKTPIFATSESRIVKYDGGRINNEETNMMNVRWEYLEFTKKILSPRKIEACGRCFARFILS